MAEGTKNGGAATKRHKSRAHSRPHGKPAIAAGSVKNEINVTPLVDVVLVLLIIFMVVTPMLSRGVAVDLPVTQHHSVRNDTGEQVVVAIQSDGKVFVEADPADNDLIAKVKQAQKKHTGELHVKGDRRLTYGQVRAVLEKLHDAGFPSAALASEELKTEGKK